MQWFTSFRTAVLKLVHAFYLLLYKYGRIILVYFVRLRSGINTPAAHQLLVNVRCYVGLKCVH